MSVSLLNVLLWVAVIVLAVFLPYNKIRDLYLGLSFPSGFLILFFLLDRFLCGFSLTQTLGRAVAVALPDIFQRFVVTERGLATDMGMMVLLIVFILFWIAAAMVPAFSTTGAAPWKRSRKRPALHLLFSFLFVIVSSFVITYALAGSRNMYYIKIGFLENLYEAMFPWRLCF